MCLAFLRWCNASIFCTQISSLKTNNWILKGRHKANYIARITRGTICQWEQASNRGGQLGRCRQGWRALPQVPGNKDMQIWWNADIIIISWQYGYLSESWKLSIVVNCCFGFLLFGHKLRPASVDKTRQGWLVQHQVWLRGNAILRT